MKITKGNVVITGVPGIKSITVDQRGSGTARITIDDGGEPSLWGLDELVEYRDALSAAIDAARELSGQEDAPRTELRTFRKGDVIPDDVVKVRDGEGDPWVWNAFRQCWECLLYTDARASAGDFLEDWGPVTEVRD